jgi:YfiH family protein
LESPLLSSLGLVAGFTTTALGSMAGANHPLEEQARNRDALAARLGFTEVVRLKQVHGARVIRVPGVEPVRPGLASPAPAEPHSTDAWPAADAMWARGSGVLLGIAGADCVPVLVAEPEPGGLIGAAHAGWQGTSLQVAVALVDELSRAGADRGRLLAALGPSIGPCCYTVDESRVAMVRDRLGDESIAGDTLDLWRANALQLERAGVATVEVSGNCTRCGGADVWSHRARGERGPQGTGLAVLGWPR